MAEVERFQALSQEKELLNERWDEQNSLLVESHERVIAELTEDYESKLADEALKMEQLQTEKAELEREFEEIKRQLEEDADRWGGGGGSTYGIMEQHCCQHARAVSAHTIHQQAVLLPACRANSAHQYSCARTAHPVYFP